jgi:hypothetical protein
MPSENFAGTAVIFHWLVAGFVCCGVAGVTAVATAFQGQATPRVPSCSSSGRTRSSNESEGLGPICAHQERIQAPGVGGSIPSLPTSFFP